MSNEMTIKTENARIEIVDQQSAEDALPIINRVMESHLENGQQQESVKRERPTECNRCGYEWVYIGKATDGTTCPDCKQWTRFDNDE